MKKLIIQALKFFSVSCVGWLIDFSAYIALTSWLGLSVMMANLISSIPAITFVFVVSTRNIFKRGTKIKLRYKYIIYLTYQFALLVCISSFGEWLFNLASASSLMYISLLTSNLKLAIKIVITPITMTINFIVMKVLAEKI
jgi:putative flippase GtrA